MQNNVFEKGNENCTGCGVCSAICPHNAIKMEYNEDGFYFPKLIKEKCTKCGICKKICIKFQNVLSVEEITKVYAMKNKDKEILNKSSSGGISYELMKICIENGYEVVGVSYDLEKEQAVTKIENQEKNLKKFLGSKYMQSLTEESFKKMIKENIGKKYAVFSTPCHIYSLNKYSEIKKNRGDFLFVDLFCHGCPSLNLWKKYLDMNKRIMKTKKINSIEFRSKVYGWHEHAFKFLTDKEEFKSSKFKNEFCDFFFNLDCLNEACYECKIKKSLNYTDIRLGDFWGEKYDEDIEGVSAVVVATELGEKILELIKQNVEIIKEHKLEEVLESQSSKKQHVINIERRNKTLNLLKNSEKLEQNHKEYIKIFSVKKRIKIEVLKILKLLPQKIFIKLRKLSHKK